MKPPRELTPGLLRLLRLALVRARPLAAGAPGAAVPGRPVRRQGAGGAGAEPDARPTSRGRSKYLEGEGRATFERPYGLAWLLQLAAELHEWDDPQARRWSAALHPLVEAAVGHGCATWLPKLAYPIRIGEHNQTAFSLGLMLDWARIAGDRECGALLERAPASFYLKDTACPLELRALGRRLPLPLPGRGRPDAPHPAARRNSPPGCRTSSPASAGGERHWLTPGVVTDPSDGKLAHLDGLNLSRAWMLEGIAAGLPPADPRLPSLRAAAAAHREAGLAAVTGKHYEGGHWLGSFATYLVTGRGLPR